MKDCCMKCVNGGITETFGFLCPSRISLVIVSKDVKLIQMDRKRWYMYILDTLRDDKTLDENVYPVTNNID